MPIRAAVRSLAFAGWDCSLPGEPRFGQGVGGEEGEELVGDFFGAGVGGGGAGAGEVLLFPDEVFELAAFGPFGPEVGAPEEEGRFRFGELGVAFDLPLDEPARGEGAFVGVRLGIEPAGGVA